MAGIEGSLEELTIKSTYLNETISLSVYKPPNYTPLKSYRLLICQDGQDFFRLGRIPRQADSLIEEMEMEETIIVGVPYPSVSTRRKWYHPDGEKSTEYRRFLACELLPFLDENFATEPLAEARILAGDSLAATISFLTALEYPSLFANVIMFSPLVNDTVLQEASNFNKSDSLTLYHIIGKDESNVKLTNGEMADFLTPNRKLNHVLEKREFRYTYKEFSGDHTWTHWQKAVPEALTFVLPL
ncbi:alpha/beta hydrolase [Shouchella patagoniensis]|uniref:alpha/beta hydrolase n=1 Tax=Shouchella patagoniensis TaxID=228576 RepID=UPI0009951661|nr:alpha/beta hydrolase-fold protein [Shouchella patagoniensis]